MTEPRVFVDRAKFLAAVQDLAQGDEIARASVDLMVEIESQIPAPWAESDPLIAERYLAARGASPTAAAANAAEFELHMRALVALATGKPVTEFSQIAEWIEQNIDGGAQ
ncbi:hypothetical protein ACFOSC_26640 [Streptantibioticus rubrisoli]|uniref:Uncharacterized protein n=1 Tax=Streptantibioticus rubrisoli TaxID=1387313 RepID=A0ABT1PEQ7_9ACTN|nr:hypothetical protein [Streptantibioticus rubrisoli]MCQ4043847.1 hypothetical protein [Streptantibioticus rubrisoli]